MGEQRTERGGCEARADPAARCDAAQRKTATAPAHGRDELPARPRAWACAQERGHARTTINTNDVLERLQAGVTGYPGVVTTVVKNADGPPVGKPINIEIRGKEIDVLLDVAEDVKKFIEDRNIPGVEALRIDIDRAKPEMPIVIDREKARRFNVSTYQVADAIRTALFGKEVSTFRIEGDDDDYEINIRMKDDYRYDTQRLMDMKITFRDMLTGQIRWCGGRWVREPKIRLHFFFLQGGTRTT
jgi:multidrug efflux pump subunit AcrB